MSFHPDDLAKLMPSGNARSSVFEVTSIGQRICGLFSGTQRKINCILDVVSGTVPNDHNGRRRMAKAKESLIFFAGLIADSRIVDPDSMRILRSDERFWLGSFLRKCKDYSRYAIVFNHGKMQDTPQADYHAQGLALLGLSGSETLDEIIGAIRSEFFKYIEPFITPSNSATLQQVPTPHKSEVMPVGGQKKKTTYSLTFDEYAAVKRLVKSCDLRLIAGRLAGYKRRGDVAGFLNVLYSVKNGVVFNTRRSGSRKTDGHRSKFGEIGSKVMGSALATASSVMDATYKLHNFLATGEMP